MEKSRFNILANYRSSQNQSQTLGNVLVCLMMLSLGIGFAQMGTRLFQDWKGAYLIGVSFLVAIEALATRKRVADMEEGRDKMIFHISEWLGFAVGIKLLIYLVNNPAQLLADIPRWQTNFIETFFTGEYIMALILTTAVWMLTRAYAGEIEELHLRELDAQWDELGKLQNALHDIRNRIASRIFVVGAVIVLLAIITRVETPVILRETQRGTLAYNLPIANVVFYFLLALVLLSQTQFALLRTRWLWQHLPISSHLASNWIKYGLLFFVALAVLVFFLPTGYSLGLLDTLRYTFQYLSQFLSVLIFIFTLPFTLCLSLLALLPSNHSTSVPPPAPTIIPQAPAANHPIAWLEFLRSLLFWVIFLGVIFLALRFYLSQNAALWAAITRFPLVRLFSNAWKRFLSFVTGARRQVRGLVQEGMKRLRQQRPTAAGQALRRVFNLARMNPREKIIFFYLNLIELGSDRGLIRKSSQTPYQYEKYLRNSIPDIDPELHHLTDNFLEARYSQHPVEPPQAEAANSLWERIKAVLRSWKQPEE